MPRTNATIEPFQVLARQDATLNWYVIADSAQHKDLPAGLLKNNGLVKCLLGATQGTPLAQHSPHLVQLCSPLNADCAWSWIRLNAKTCPCISVIATPLTFDVLFQQLAKCTEIILPDGDTMFFAFWDPAILGTLMGQADDMTLHVKGPVLNAMQQSMLTSTFALWCYWDRASVMHSIVTNNGAGSKKAGTLSLNQGQVDDLVEASVPDHALSYIELNHSQIIEDVPVNQRYPIICKALSEARAINLSSMKDLINFCCAYLIYGSQMRENREILYLLDKTKRQEMSFLQAIQEFPD